MGTCLFCQRPLWPSDEEFCSVACDMAWRDDARAEAEWRETHPIDEVSDVGPAPWEGEFDFGGEPAVCVECGRDIPEEDDVIEFEDGGRLCEECDRACE